MYRQQPPLRQKSVIIINTSLDLVLRRNCNASYSLH